MRERREVLSSVDVEVLSEVGHQAALMVIGPIVEVERHAAGVLLRRVGRDVGGCGGDVRVGFHTEFADEAAGEGGEGEFLVAAHDAVPDFALLVDSFKR